MILIAANPRSGSRSREGEIAALVASLQAAGYADTQVVSLDQLAAAIEWSRGGDAPPTVIAAGGDGTAAAVAAAVDSTIAMLPYPMGTENLLARYLGVTADPQAICRLLQAGRSVQFDAGSANGRLFLLMASCGFDADVVRHMESMRRGNINHFSYLQPIYESLMNYRFPTIRVTTTGDDGREQVFTGKWAFAINLPRYAGGLQIVPAANANDGLLDVCVFKRGSLLHGLVYLGGILTGTHESWPDCQVASGRRIRIEADGRAPYQLDGDLGGYLPVDIEVLPGRVQMIVPPDWRPTVGGDSCWRP